MQIKIVADAPNWETKNVLAAISNALKQKDSAVLLEMMPVGEPFAMVDDRKGIKIEFTVMQ